MKEKFVKDLKEKDTIQELFMIMKKIKREQCNTIAFIGDKTGDVKSVIYDVENELKIGDVIKVEGVVEDKIIQAKKFKKIENYDMGDFLPAITRDVDEIMKEIEEISNEEIKSPEAKALNDYFFKNEEFLKKFKNGIGGLRQHHNYIGGLPEHTLNVMYLSKVLAYRYDCRYKEIAILGAKLHDIGKIEEYYTDRPFEVTTIGDMEGHIVIGVAMVEEAFNANKDVYSEEFKNRIKGCIVQHHGKVEYGSPKATNMEESFIINFADNTDAVMNRIWQIKQNTDRSTWSDYDRRIGTRLYL